MSNSMGRPVAAITGGARGIGFAIAERLAADGMRVVIGDIDFDLARTAAGKIEGAVGFWVDVAEPGEFEAFLNEAEEAVGPVDVLVNNAGIMPIGPFVEQDVELCRRAVDINVHGPMNGMRAVLPRMLARGGGHIVNIASTAGKVASPGGALYCATKHAVVGMSDAIRQEYGAQGIVVTTVLPSFTNTDLISGTKGLRGIPNVEPADVAKAVAGAIKRKRPTVFVPGMLRSSIWLHDTLPARANDAVGRLFGADRMFLDFDREKRRSYETRIGSDS